MNNTTKLHGFSLVELSIVLVILGLLTGGILTGQSLIKAAQLRSVTTEFTNYQTAVHTFKNKYFTMPGDMSNATIFWGKLAAKCNGATGTVQTNGTCNGDGDSDIDEGTAANEEAERFLFWQHLALAGLIEGQYSGLAGSEDVDHAVLNQNVPSSKYPGAGWEIENKSPSGSSTHYAMQYNNNLKFAAPIIDDELDNPIIPPEDAWNIDKKIDDGKPGQGKIIARFWDTCTTSSSNTDLAGNYALTVTTPECALYIKDVAR